MTVLFLNTFVTVPLNSTNAAVPAAAELSGAV